MDDSRVPMLATLLSIDGWDSLNKGVGVSPVGLATPKRVVRAGVAIEVVNVVLASPRWLCTTLWLESNSNGPTRAFIVRSARVPTQAHASTNAMRMYFAIPARAVCELERGTTLE